jgi:hypothetical protein
MKGLTAALGRPHLRCYDDRPFGTMTMEGHLQSQIANLSTPCANAHGVHRGHVDRGEKKPRPAVVALAYFVCGQIALSLVCSSSQRPTGAVVPGDEIADRPSEPGPDPGERSSQRRRRGRPSVPVWWHWEFPQRARKG